MSRPSFSDVVCILSTVAMLAMTLASYMYTTRLTYEVATGIVCSFFAMLPYLLKRYNLVRLPNMFVVLIVIAIALHAYGVLLIQYDLLYYYDTVTHFTSSLVVATCVFYTLVCYNVYSNGAVHFDARSMPIAIGLVMLAFSAYWEVFEYLVDVIAGTNMQYSPFDTLRDTVCNTMGSICVCIAIGIYMKSHTAEDIAHSFQLGDRLKKVISDPFGTESQGNGE